MESVYSILDNEAREWWYHAKLRAEGNPREARRRERDSILRNVQTLRTAYLAVVHCTGSVSLYMRPIVRELDGGGRSTETATLTGCSLAYAEAARRCGIPVIDFTGCDPWSVIDLEPVTLDTLGSYVVSARAIGATIR